MKDTVNKAEKRLNVLIAELLAASSDVVDVALVIFEVVGAPEKVLMYAISKYAVLHGFP